MKLPNFRPLLRKYGFAFPLTKEEEGRQALEEFADKAFRQPFRPRTGSTQLSPPISRDDPRHPQFIPPKI